jgi:hypothetical protein
MATISGIAGLPSSIVGGFLWVNFNPEILFISAFSMGTVSTLIFYFLMKNTK